MGKKDILLTVGLLAQLVERLPYKQNVIGSSPIRPNVFSLSFSLFVSLDSLWKKEKRKTDG